MEQSLHQIAIGCKKTYCNLMSLTSSKNDLTNDKHKRCLSSQLTQVARSCSSAACKAASLSQTEQLCSVSVQHLYGRLRPTYMCCQHTLLAGKPVLAQETRRHAVWLPAKPLSWLQSVCNEDDANSMILQAPILHVSIFPVQVQACPLRVYAGRTCEMKASLASHSQGNESSNLTPYVI